jgi:ABC-2 type transport system ATP-binding protein
MDGVWLRYRHGPWVLREVDLDLPAGTFAVLLGRNGAGKSTLLAAAAGLLRPARGRITGRPRHVGLALERFPTEQPFTVRQYLAHAARMRGLGPATADVWIERLALGTCTEVRLGQLSKGTGQKVGLAQALLAPPGLLVLDEPAEGLDSTTRAELPGIVAEQVAAGSTVLASDHLDELTDLPGALHLRLADGRVETGSPRT